MVLKYVWDGNLEDLISKRKRARSQFSEAECIQIINCLIEACADIHNKNVWHRDIKPSNILIKNNLFKVCDYGFTRIVDANPDSLRDYTKVGTPFYCCPQILNDEKYSSKCDVWSIGIILYQLLYFTYPYKKEVNNMKDLADRMKAKEPIKLPKKRKVSKDVKELLSWLLQKDEKNRPLAVELLKSDLYQAILQ